MNIDLNKLNSITKYPSILTYHQLADREKDGLKEKLIETSKFNNDDEVHLFEKIDGENSRIVLIGDGQEVDYFIGSRRELLLAKGDRIGIQTGNIANYFRPIADRLAEWFKGSTGLLAIYFESYGGLSPKAKQYTSDKTQYGRVFDAFELSFDELNNLLGQESTKIASWRDNGHQPFFNREKLEVLIKTLELPEAPLLAVIKGNEIPKDVIDTLEWLKLFQNTQSGINVDGKAEGVIARTKDRKKIAKIRFEDYERTIRFRERNEQE